MRLSLLFCHHVPAVQLHELLHMGSAPRIMCGRLAADMLGMWHCAS